jgi:hypothetical protein
MPQLIEVPGHGQVEFPDEMDDIQIAEAIKANMPELAQPQAQEELPTEMQQFAQAQGAVPSVGAAPTTELAPQIDRTISITPEREELSPEEELKVARSEQEGYRILGAAALNTPVSAARFVRDVTSVVRHPIQTAKGIKGLSFGLVELLIPGEQKDEAAVRAMGSFLKDRYGSVEDALETLEEDPVGFMSDISILFTGGGLLATKVGRMSTVGKNIQTIGSVVDPISGAGLALNKLVTTRTPINSLVKTALDLPKKKGLIRIDDLSNEFLRKGLNVTRKSLKQLDDDIGRVKSQIDNIVDSKTKDGVRLRTAEIVDSLDGLIDNAAKEGLDIKDFRIINRLRDDFVELHGKTVSPRKLQDIKVGLNKGFKSDLTTRFGEVRAKVRDKLRISAKTQLEELHPELKALNADQGVMIELRKAIEERVIKLEKQPIIPVRGLVAGTVAGGALGAGSGSVGAGLAFGATAIAVDKIITSPRIQIAVAKAINKHNQALAKAGKLSVITRPAFQAGRAGEVIQETP